MNDVSVRVFEIKYNETSSNDLIHYTLNNEID